MMDRFSRAFSALAMLAVLLPVNGASAATVNCPGTVSTSDREFSLTTDPGATCLASGPGNINGNNDVVNQMGYVTIDKSDDGVFGGLTFTPPTSGLSGTFAINAPGFFNFVIGLKSGEGRLNPDWAAFLLPAGVLFGSWSISGSQELSHAVLYGNPTHTPLPGALVLMGTALAGSYGIGKWRRRRSSSRAASN